MRRDSPIFCIFARLININAFMRYYEVEFSVSPKGDGLQDARDLIAAMAGDAGFEAFEETDGGTKGYVQTTLLDRTALDDLANNFPMPGVKVSYTIKEAEYRDWNEQWEQEGFEPIAIGDRCCIHDGRHLPQSHYDITIGIDAKLAFGTGTHETTRMMVERLLAADMTGKRMLDCGCGTGILAIAALKMGAAMAVGYDIDEWSVENSRHNATANGVADRFTALQGDASAIDRTEGKFNVVAANINCNILLADMPRFCEAMAEGALLLLSGFYESDAQAITRCAEALGLSPAHTASSGHWACLEFRKGPAAR